MLEEILWIHVPQLVSSPSHVSSPWELKLMNPPHQDD